MCVCSMLLRCSQFSQTSRSFMIYQLGQGNGRSGPQADVSRQSNTREGGGASHHPLFFYDIEAGVNGTALANEHRQCAGKMGLQWDNGGKQVRHQCKKCMKSLQAKVNVGQLVPKALCVEMWWGHCCGHGLACPPPRPSHTFREKGQ